MKSKVYNVDTRVLSLTIAVNWIAVRCVLLTYLTLGILAFLFDNYRTIIIGIMLVGTFLILAYCLSPGSKSVKETVVKKKLKPVKPREKRVHALSPVKENIGSTEETMHVDDGPDIKMVKAPNQVDKANTSTEETATDVEEGAPNYAEIYSAVSAMDDLI